jgi:HAD superfamily phosphoserine phosphatase-like hydrolase
VANILCLDFDDTIVLDNTTRQLFEEFADPAWHGFEERYHAGELSVEQFNAAALDLVEAPREQITGFVRERARPREGLLELCDWAHWNGWLVTVVSSGFDICSGPVLDHLGLDRVTRHTGRTERGYRWRVRYYSPRGIELQDGFKLSYAQAYRNAGDFVVYAGDGESDIAAAQLARVVFARSSLLTALNGQRGCVFAFDTFQDVTRVLEREVAHWEAGETG